MISGAPTKVLFIGGYGRSGSTLLDRMLGEVEGLCSAGELRHVFAEGYRDNRLCGCGEPFRECSFWREVSALAFGGMDRFDPEPVLATQGRVDRWQRLPQLVAGVAGRRRRAELARHRETLRRLYGAIAAVSEAAVIVDSSKDVSHGYVAAGVEGIDLRVVHLVRDSRAVAHSWQRRKFNPGSGRDMDRHSLLKTSVEWAVINGLTRPHRRLGRPYELLRYADLSERPAQAVGRVLELLGEGHRRVPVSPAGEIELHRGHTAAGNPMRFKSGPMRVRPDREWRERMPWRSRAMVTALTAPSLHRYG